MSKHPFSFIGIRLKVYSLEYAEDKADYLAGMFIQISEYLVEHPEFQKLLQPTLNIISMEIEHYRKHALADSQKGIRQPYHPRGHGRPRRESDDDNFVIERSPEELKQEEEIIKLLQAEALKQKAPITDPDRLSYKEAAELLGLAHSTVQKYASLGKIPVHKTPTGGSFISRKEILEWKDSGSKSQAEELKSLLEKVEGKRVKSFRPSRERKKEERKQNMKKWTSKEVEEVYKKRKR